MGRTAPKVVEVEELEKEIEEGEVDLEVMLAVFPPLKLKEDTIREGPEALGADEAAAVEQVSVRVEGLAGLLKGSAAVSAVARRVPGGLGGGHRGAWQPPAPHLHVVRGGWGGGRGGGGGGSVALL